MRLAAETPERAPSEVRHESSSIRPARPSAVPAAAPPLVKPGPQSSADSALPMKTHTISHPGSPRGGGPRPGRRGDLDRTRWHPWARTNGLNTSAASTPPGSARRAAGGTRVRIGLRADGTLAISKWQVPLPKSVRVFAYLGGSTARPGATFCEDSDGLSRDGISRVSAVVAIRAKTHALSLLPDRGRV
eukprot:scaffold5294_cov175-Prasinococcus_capsulatus_cf.AAC.1